MAISRRGTRISANPYGYNSSSFWAWNTTLGLDHGARTSRNGLCRDINVWITAELQIHQRKTDRECVGARNKLRIYTPAGLVLEKPQRPRKSPCAARRRPQRRRLGRALSRHIGPHHQDERSCQAEDACIICEAARGCRGRRTLPATGSA